jgi:hypothetical protein
MQSKIEVGYIPYSTDLRHPGDRRRLAAWAQSQGTELKVENPLESDVLVLSNAANFNYWLKRAKQPVILDLVDGYLGEHPPFIRDAARNVLRSIRGTSNLGWITYTNHIRTACRKSDAVIVASKEQRDVVLEYNKNVFVILDDHSELDSVTSADVSRQTNSAQPLLSPHLFWEGFGYTLKHFKKVAKDLDKFLFDSGWGMYLITNEQFPKWGGYIGTVRTSNLVKKWFPLSKQAIQIIPWSIENVIKYANLSTLGLIPIDTEDKFAALKSENKLLSMWQLGLPALFSNTPAYSRVATQSHQEGACIKNGAWLTALMAYSQAPGEREELKRLGSDYISKQHTHEILMTKWNKTLKEIRDLGPQSHR